MGSALSFAFLEWLFMFRCFFYIHLIKDFLGWNATDRFTNFTQLILTGMLMGVNTTLLQRNKSKFWIL
jgi:hypothetical protein